MNNTENKSKSSRRIFLKKIWTWLGITAGLEAGVLSLEFLSHSKKNKEKESENYFSAGKVTEFKNNSVTAFRRERFYLTRLQDGGFIAQSITCTHLGCPVIWDENEKLFVCPCHSSKFNIRGNVLSPPADRSLDIYPVLIENGTLMINIAQKVKRKNFNKNDVVYPL